MTNPVSSYICLTRMVFNVEPVIEPTEKWDDFKEFEAKLRDFYESLLCSNCEQLLHEPCSPKKIISKNQHYSCNHRVCLDCIGKNRATTLNCKLCSNFTLFEKSLQTKIVLKLYQELCELIKGSWIYDYIKNHDTGQPNSLSLNEMIENGINYERNTSTANLVSVTNDLVSSESSADENSSSSLIKPVNIKMEEKSPQSVPYQQQTFPTISPLPYHSPNPVPMLQAEPFAAVQEVVPATEPSIPVSIPQSQQITPIITAIPSIAPNQPVLKASPLFSHVPMRVKTITHQQTTTQMTTKSIMSPMKIQQTAPTIYSVMYTGGSGNKITLKRKAPDEHSTAMSVSADMCSTSNNTTFVKTETFKPPPVQINTHTQPQHHHQQIPIVVPTTSNFTALTTQSSLTVASPNNPNEPQKRRGCRCGNATAAPGKLTCCGQRCPCYVDSKACIDCKCKGCRNPHYIDGQKKMRHQVPDQKMQQIQQQNFLQSIQQQAAMLKEAQKTATIASTTTTMIKTEDMSLMESTLIAKSHQNSINNCIISMNSNGQYQIKPRIIMKEPVKGPTMSPLLFPTTSTGQIGNSNSSIQIVGLYSQVPMSNDKKIIIKNEIQTTGSVVSSAQFTSTNSLNTSML